MASTISVDQDHTGHVIQNVADPSTDQDVATKHYADLISAGLNAVIFKGVIDCSGNPNYPAADRGFAYIISVAGKIGGASGIDVLARDLIICLTNGTPSGDQAAVGDEWTIVAANVDGSVTGPLSAVDSDFVQFDGTTGILVKDGGLSLDTDDTLAADSDSRIPSQQAVKGYVDAEVAGVTIPTGNLTDVGTDGIVVTGGTGAVVGTGTSIAQHVADASHNGYLSLTDWSTFNGKQSAITPAALTKTDDTNVTLALGGTPATALLQAASLTLGWSGTLGISRGGFGKAMTDPNAHRLVIWDDTDGDFQYVTIGTGLTYDHATHTLTSAGGSATHAVTLAVDGSSAVVTAGTKNPIKIPYGGTLTGWLLIGTPSGSVTVDILRAADGAGLPVTSIVGAGTKPSLSSAVENSSTSFTSWTSTTLTAKDNLAISLSGITACTYVSLVLYFT
jgi:hypothetical protein